MLLPGRLPVRIYSCFDESRDIAALYRQALAAGARAVVGPLTRNGVATLAALPDIPVPTLALNVVEGHFANQLYFFGMEVEAEARLAAQLARRLGLHQAILIATRTPLAKRLQLAFKEEWQQLGGKTLQEIEYGEDPAVFAEISAQPDTVVFLAADADKARLIRPYLPNALPTYATSLIFVGNSDPLINFDLKGIRFVDMPWLLQADHPAVMVYPHSKLPLSVDHERLYALGIDAFRLIELLLADDLDRALPLDGVSGKIELDNQTFRRRAVPAMFLQGQIQPRQPLLPGQPTEKP